MLVPALSSRALDRCRALVGELEMVRVGGDHHTMLQPPHVAAMAAALTSVAILFWAKEPAAEPATPVVPPPPMGDLPKHGDKLEHLLAYGVLAAAAVQVWRAGRPLLLAGLGLVLMGVLLEFAQGALTATRQADPFDALANTLGVGLGLLMVFTPWRDLLPRRQ